jgi:small ubiquitin-related modifier
LNFDFFPYQTIPIFFPPHSPSHFHRESYQTGEETFFKIKKTTKMAKVFETYATRKGIQPSSIRFMLDGERIDPTHTPKMLEMDDQDQIDCMLEQTGGVSL